MVLGGRDDATCRKLLDKVGVKGKTFVTDDWEGCHRVIPEAQLFTGQDLTFPIEQDNSNIRHCLARFRRRTKVVSKCRTMVDPSLRLLHHLQHLAAFASYAQSAYSGLIRTFGASDARQLTIKLLKRDSISGPLARLALVYTEADTYD